jgi:hypothetical protein
MRTRWTWVALLLAATLSTKAMLAQDASAIMAKAAANVEGATEARKWFVYQQTIRARLVGGSIVRKEDRKYEVVPSETSTEKKLVAFRGEYRKGKRTVSYSEPVPQHGDAEHKDIGLDAELLEDLTEGLVNAKDSRDGIPRGLFPLRPADLPAYTFTMKGEAEHQGRRIYRIGFEPLKNGHCIHIGKDEDDDCGSPPWAGEAWIDAAEMQPVRIDTRLASKVPWAIRTFFGTNLKQLGFAITYRRVAEGVWFPATYGTEFQLDLVFFYKRTITMNLESSGFQKTDARSKIEFDLAKQPELP